MTIRKSEGFALIDVLFVCAIMGVLATIALPRMLMAKQSAGAASAIGSLRTIHSAQLTFALTCGAGFYAPDLTTLGRAPVNSREAFISPNLAGSNSVTRSGYVIEVDATPYSGAPGSCNGLGVGEAAQGWRATADPTSPENARFFGTNVNGSVWQHNQSLSSIPEVGEPSVGEVLK